MTLIVLGIILAVLFTGWTAKFNIPNSGTPVDRLVSLVLFVLALVFGLIGAFGWGK